MSEDLIIRHCAPTLAGIKTGNLFTASYDSIEQLDEEIRSMNARLRRKGLRIVRLRAKDNRALIYVYRPDKLADDLDRKDAKAILAQSGYPQDAESAEHLNMLSKRINECPEFPHEIGIFLGYPPEDVRGFIEYGGRRCKACGLWKVYGDVCSARKLFRKYHKCKCVYMECLERGVPFEKLVVRRNFV